MKAIIPCVIELRVVSLPAMRQRDHEHAELGLRQSLAVGVGLDQRRDDVVTGFFGFAGRQLHCIPHQFACRGQRVVVGELRVVAADHLVGPVEQLVAVLRRHPEQAGDGLQRQLAGHLKDEVARALPPRLRSAIRRARS